MGDVVSSRAEVPRRRCLNCHRKLPEGCRADRETCSDSCRRAKNRRLEALAEHAQLVLGRVEELRRRHKLPPLRLDDSLQMHAHYAALQAALDIAGPEAPGGVVSLSNVVPSAQLQALPEAADLLDPALVRVAVQVVPLQGGKVALGIVLAAAPSREQSTQQ